MRVKIIGVPINDGGPVLASRSFATYLESLRPDENGREGREVCEIILSVEQAQQLVISLFGMLPAADRPVLTWPYSRRAK